MKRGGQEKGAGQLPGALGEGALLGFGKGGLSPTPGPGERGGGEIWEGGVQRARDCDEVPAREIAIYQHTHAERAPGRELPGV